MVAERALVVAVADGYPSAPGHVLVIPRRHVARLAELTAAEHEQLFALARDLLLAPAAATTKVPDGYTVGVNDGSAAGQTISHVHLHLIPRTWGDTADPRGGIRWVLPDTARYW